MIDRESALRLKEFFNIRRAEFRGEVKGVQRQLPDWIAKETRAEIENAIELQTAFHSVVTLGSLMTDLVGPSHAFLRVAAEGGQEADIRAHIAFRYVRENLYEDSKKIVDWWDKSVKGISDDRGSEYTSSIRSAITKRSDAEEMFYRLACEGFDRSGKEFTPSDIARLMCRLAGASDRFVDIYTDRGMGIYYGGLIEHPKNLKLVGDEIRSQEIQGSMMLPARLSNALERASHVLDRAAIFERLLVELETFPEVRVEKGASLVVNAANNPVPFTPRKEDSLNSLDFLLQATYPRVVALVQNGYLTGGKYLEPEEVISHCLSRGLRSVIQLPNGSIGAMHEAYSLLIFEPGRTQNSVDFRQIDPGSETGKNAAYGVAERGFGHPWRKVALNLAAFTVEGDTPQQRRHPESMQTLREKLSGSENSRVARSELSSFEASRFLTSRSISSEITGVTKWVKLADIADLHRIQHLPAVMPGIGIAYREISADALGDFNDLSKSEEKHVGEEYESRLLKAALHKGNLFVCIRGPIGRVGFINYEPRGILLPNQSFVKISLKERRSPEVTGDILYWWLRSEICQKHLASRSIYAGVKRLSMQDLEMLEVPVLSEQRLMKERSSYAQWIGMVALMFQSRDQAIKLQKSGFTDD